jgi:hypothetical protein
MAVGRRKVAQPVQCKKIDVRYRKTDFLRLVVRFA